MTNKQKAEMYARIEKHGQNLITLFGLPAATDPIKLAKQMHRLENAAHRQAEAYCNGTIDGDQWETFKAQTLAKVDKLVKFSTCAPPVPVFVNGDPRGYALKIKDSYKHATQAVLHRDMGGYGILAPDLTA